MGARYEKLTEEDEEVELDFTDLREQYNVRLNENLDTFVVLDNLPLVSADRIDKLKGFISKKLQSAGKIGENGFHMPLGSDGLTEGYAFVEFTTSKEASKAVKISGIDGVTLDKKFKMKINKLTDIERVCRVSEEYHPPSVAAYTEREHLKWWIGDTQGRDQFVTINENVTRVFWNEKDDPPELVFGQKHWSEGYVQWSPNGSYLLTKHSKGIRIWGGPSWALLRQFPHPAVTEANFSPDEKYLITWSPRPIALGDIDSTLTADECGNNYIAWNVATGKPIRSFENLELPSQESDENEQSVRHAAVGHAFKWSADSKYVARMAFGQSIFLHTLPSMSLATIKIEGVQDFEWAPATAQREGARTYEQLFCYWTPEINSNPAKVGLMSIPSKEIIRTRNLFNVCDAKLHWQSEGRFLCVKVDRHSKSKKSMATVLEIFRIQEKNIPVEVIDTIKDTVFNFDWEPKGDRFVLITKAESSASNVSAPPKTAVSFFALEKSKGITPGNFKHVMTYDKKISNAIYWSPKGRFVVIASMIQQQGFAIDFWDFDYEGDKEEKDRDLNCNVHLMNSSEHYGISFAQWDPSGRYLTTMALKTENGYHLYDLKGTLLREEHDGTLVQFLWRPRPPTLLSKEVEKKVRKNLREDYSKAFDEQDHAKKNRANQAVIDLRRRLLVEWRAWREEVEERVGESEGQPDIGGDVEIIEETMDELLEENEEVME